MLFVPMIPVTICASSMKQKSVKFALQQCLEENVVRSLDLIKS